MERRDRMQLRADRRGRREEAGKDMQAYGKRRYQEKKNEEGRGDHNG